MDTDRLKQHLREQSEAMLPVGSGAEAARLAGGRIRRTRQAAWFSMSFVAVALVGLGLFGLRYEPTAADTAEPTETTTAPENTETTAAPGPVFGSDLPSAEIDWTLVETPSPTLEHVFSWDGMFYALSTAPGKAPDIVDQAIYTSTDGFEWNQTSLDESLWISAIDHHEGSLYAIGTGPGFLDDRAAPVEVSVATTRDGGVSWEDSELPLAAVGPAARKDLLYRSVDTQLAAGPNGVVAVVETIYGVNYFGYLPKEYRDRPDVFVRRTSDGLTVLDSSRSEDLYQECFSALDELGYLGGFDKAGVYNSEGELVSDEIPEACRQLDSEGGWQADVVLTLSWDELGEVLPRDHFVEYFFSADGESFEPVFLPAAESRPSQLAAIDDGFLMVLRTAEDEQQIWFSADGRSWEPVSDPLNFVPYGFGAIGDAWVAAGQRPGLSVSRPVAYASDDRGDSWREIDIASLLGVSNNTTEVQLSDVRIGSDLAILDIYVEPRHEGPDTEQNSLMESHILVSSDLVTWEEIVADDLGVDSERVWINDVFFDGETYLLSGWQIDGVTGDRFAMVGQPG